MYCLVNNDGAIETHTTTNDTCFNCQNLYRCPLFQALNKEYVFLHYSEIEVKECGMFKRI